ncbi:MAG: FAD-dependent oxidoreductase, partial [Candidatus Hydrogenedentes bacterium]|nr:FAD-dependent oxidoreductase [Candidatus Hydrogenedentota bacterium]
MHLANAVESAPTSQLRLRGGLRVQTCGRRCTLVIAGNRERKRMATFCEISGWIATPPARRPALRGARSVDAAIVGAGYTGLSTALALRKEGMSVALLEREFAGFGASGRNAGHAAPTIGKDLPSLITFFGMDRAKQLIHFAESAVRHFESLIADYGIACDYVPCGNIVAGVHPSHEKKLRKAADAGVALGGDMEFLDNAAMRARGLPPAFTCGMLEKCGGVLDPGKYVLGLRQAAIDAGVELYEDTPVTRIADGPKVRIETPGGTVEADRAVLATNAYTRSTGRMKHAQLPLAVTLMTSAPFSDDQSRRIGWPMREGVSTAHEILESYRWTVDGRLMIGTKTVRQGFGNRLAPADHSPTADLLERTFRARFPEVH